ncbi:MAG: DNA-protecting protein DprA [Bacteroides sp.]|nr:DNA-protecting protein DprA [Bacteroides sp.]MBD5357256.1 DNA-protecting protein DprA [Bacteroides sp.]
MADTELTYKIALSMLKGINADFIRRLDDYGITPEDIFHKSTSEISEALGMHGKIVFEKMMLDEALFRARREETLINQHHIKTHFLLDDSYPARLSEVADAPVVIYQLGDADLNAEHVINVVGTRHCTPYGVDFCNKLITDLSLYFPQLCVVSGLAYGIDAAAHATSLANEVNTVAVVAHGLNMIYPSAHRDLAKRILSAGGAIITEYPFGEKPFRQRFLERNRIVAGLADVTIVVESDIKGGAMSTANTAFSYSRDVMALPGRVSDQYSSGCNHLIRKEKAHLIGCANDLIELTGWKPLGMNIDVRQRNLFPELEGDVKLVYDTVRFSQDPMQLDRIHQLTMIPVGKLLSVLGEMEFDGIIVRHPGNRFSIA